MAFVFGLQTLKLIDFTKIFQSKGLKPKNKDHANFYECCDLTKKIYLAAIYYTFRMIFYSFETKLSMRVHEFFFLKNGCNNADLSSVSHIMTRTSRNVEGERKISKAAPDFRDGVKKR